MCINIALGFSMGLEANIESIRALEEQIEEGKGDIIQLKRARNSLLNISTRVPPEILGDIFSWTLVRPDPTLDLDSHFDGFPKGCYNFLLVCHHWFEVASHTPGLWSFWGTDLGEWKRWYSHHPGGAPLDLVLSDYGSETGICTSLDDTLGGKLRDCARRDVVRQVHLWSCEQGLLSSIISSLTPEDEGIHHRSIESIHLENRGALDLDVSIFFARTHLPELRSLILSGNMTILWDHLARQTTLLTTMSFDLLDTEPSPPTTSQLFAILVSNPSLRVLSLDHPMIPQDDGDASVPQATLPHLKRLSLTGGSHDVFRLLERLVFPRPLEFIRLILSFPTADDVLQTLGPFVRHYFQHHHESLDRLWMKTYSRLPHLLVRIETEDTVHIGTPLRTEFEMTPDETPPGCLQDLCHDFLAFTPRERVYAFETDLPMDRLEDLLVTMPNIEALQLRKVVLSEGFLQPNPAGPFSKARLLPSLRSLYLEKVSLNDNDWGPLMAYLAHQSSDGETIRLTLIGRVPHMCPDVEEVICDLVQELTFDCGPVPRGSCPTGRCKNGL
jgi:hypothetical protein